MDYRDFGMKGKKALVCASSAGLGRACAHALAAHGASVWINGRSEERVFQTIKSFERDHGLKVEGIVADISKPEGRRSALLACPEPDILVNNADGPKPGDFRDFDEAAWLAAVSANMISPIMLIRDVVDGMIARRWGRIVNITSTAVKAPLPLLGLSNGARSGFTGFVAGLAREVAAYGVTINNLLPGRMETDRLARYVKALAEKQSVLPETIKESLVASNPMKRFGAPEELGAICAYLASMQAGYLTGQNIVVDGGEYPGL